MRKISERQQKIRYLKKHATTCVKKWINQELPPPPTPAKTLDKFKIQVDRLGDTAIIRVCAYSKDNIYRKLFTIKDLSYIEQFEQYLDKLIVNGEFYRDEYNKKFLEV